jgi:hypothetical protein
MKAGLKPACQDELKWAWEALSSCTCCKSLSVMVSGACVFQAGLLPEGGKPGKVVDGAISRRVMNTGRADFLANLALFPGELRCLLLLLLTSLDLYLCFKRRFKQPFQESWSQKSDLNVLLFIASVQLATECVVLCV